MGCTRINSTRTTIAPTPPVPTAVQGDTAAGISEARQAARAFTDSLTPAPGPDMADTLVLVVSELVTNALRHGGGHYTLELSAGPDTVTAAVSDPDPAHPRERTPDLNGGSGGFGWHMIRHLTSHLTITPRSGGKTIHAQLPR
ncbi:ATP-binding protein [Streptomyces sp. NPDC051064]|uniref:ATP-binding protein n=1 Tax=Streptomyces sp. NPDC051064 TaxID=3365641 RepID=UPI00378D94B3